MNQHNPIWHTILTKIPSDIPNFEGKAGEDPTNHVMTFCILCSSNSLVYDNIKLRIF